MQHAGLQRERDQRGAEHQAAVDQVALLRRLAPRVQDRDEQIEREEQQQERLGAGELVGVVLKHAPDRADAEGERETEQVQRPPRAPPGDGEDRGIEHGVVREQRHVVAAAGGQPDRCHEAGQDAEHGQRARVLQHRQHAHAGNQQDAHRKRDARLYQLVALERGEDGQQQDADRPALQGQCEQSPALALHPAEHQPGQRAGRDGGQAQFDRCVEPALVAGVFEQRGHAGQQHQHADLDRHVAFGEPAFDRADDALAQVRAARQRRHCRFDGPGRRARRNRRRRDAGPGRLELEFGLGLGRYGPERRNSGNRHRPGFLPGGRGRRCSRIALRLLQRGHPSAQAGDHHQGHDQQYRHRQQQQYHQDNQSFHSASSSRETPRPTWTSMAPAAREHRN